MYDISQNPFYVILYTEHQSQVSAPGPMAPLFTKAEQAGRNNLWIWDKGPVIGVWF